MENRNPESFKRLTISAERLPALVEEQAKKTEYAAERARLLLGCYRTGDANDAETYVAAIAATLARYPERVMDLVTDPRVGLPRKKTWLPSVKEVYDACEEEQMPMREAEAREARIKAQLAEREKAQEKPTLAQLKAKYGDNWGLGADERAAKPQTPAPTKDQLRHHYQHYGLGFSPKEELAEHIERGFSPSTQ